MKRIWRVVSVGVLFASLTVLQPVGVAIASDAIVSTCDEGAFNAALTTAQTNGGGTITFSCSGQIDFTSEKTITAAVTIIGGGNNITFDGGDGAQLFQIDPGATLELDGVTLQNGSAEFGGAIYNDGGTLTVTASTFSGNIAISGGAIYNDGGTLNLASSILANSPSGGNCYSLGGTITSQGSNLSDATTCNPIAAGDQEDIDPLLGPLADNGGPTQTMLPGSPAIDAARNCATDTDQRGYSRPQGAASDIGSIEVRQSATYPLCASYYTGAVSSPLNGQGCAAWQVELVVPGDVTFCINPWTGKISWYAS